LVLPLACLLLVESPARAGRVRGIAAGDGVTCFVTVGTRLSCTGQNDRGQLGDGTTTERHVPTLAAFIQGSLPGNISEAALADSNMCATAAAVQNLYCTGANDYGQIGDGTTIERHTLTLVGVSLNPPSGVGGINPTAGETACIPRSSGAGPFCWGRNTFGAVGDGTTDDRSTPVLLPQFFPLRTSGGGGHTCGVQYASGVYPHQVGTLWCWGNNADDVLGAGPGLGPSSATPVQVTALGAQVAIDNPSPLGISNQQQLTLGVGVTHTCTIMGDGTLWCWGHNEYGQLGDGTTTNQPLPVQVTGLTGVTQVAVSAKGQFTCATDASFKIYCWGRNDRGQLGDGTTVSRSVPAPVLGGLGAFDISAGTNHACLHLQNDIWYGWGGNEHGQLGDGTTLDRLAPVRVGPGAPPAVPAMGAALRWLAAAALAAIGATAASRRARRMRQAPRA
jgi:alpha-tubulin suppressor-like RCC1 family protein